MLVIVSRNHKIFNQWYLIILFGVMFTRVSYVRANEQYLSSNSNPDLYDFTKEMCHERAYRMKWKEILKPCEGKLGFGTKIYSTNRTNAKQSKIINKQIRNTGEYSGFRIKTYDLTNNSKTIGGDTWRIFLRGPAFIEPYVYDLNNGEYDVMFLLMEPGVYNITVALEGSLCSSFVNPPYDWFKKGDYNGHFQSAWLYKYWKGWTYLIEERLWNILANFHITVQPGKKEQIKKNLNKLSNWQHLCGLSKCTFLTDGMGRWVHNKWSPYSKDIIDHDKHADKRKRQHEGVFWVYGDCYAHHFWQVIHNTTFCTQQFHKCNSTYNWIYPRWNPDAEKDKSIHLQRHFNIDIQWLVNYFETVLKENEELNQSNSIMFLNLGLHFIRASSFQEYRTIIDKYINIIKKYKTKFIWRTTTSIYRAEKISHKRFQTYQRALLFNAYAMSAMCQAGIPIVDVFPMTSSIPYKPLDGIHYNINIFRPVIKTLQNYLSYV